MPFLKSAPPNKDKCKIFWRNKNAYIWYQKCLILVFFTKNAWFRYFWGRIFLKNYCYSWNQHPEILLIAKFYEKTKIPKIGNKNALFGYICGRILKNYNHIWNQHLGISIIAKFCEEKKIPTFGTRNALFGYFWGRILKNYSHIWGQHLGVSKIAKFCKETKMP